MGMKHVNFEHSVKAVSMSVRHAEWPSAPWETSQMDLKANLALKSFFPLFPGEYRDQRCVMGLLSTVIGVVVCDQCLLLELNKNFQLFSWEIKALKPSASPNRKRSAQREHRGGCGLLHLVQKSLHEGSEAWASSERGWAGKRQPQKRASHLEEIPFT